MNITTEMVAMTGAICSVLFVIWFRIEQMVKENVKDTKKRVEDVERKYEEDRRKLSDFMLEVARNYAPVEHIKDVEARLMVTMNHMSDQMNTMPDRLARIVRETLAAVNGIGKNT